MTTIKEGEISFEFPDDWKVVKYDGEKGFASKNCKFIQGTKKVDILALGSDGKLRIFEIKDYRWKDSKQPHNLYQEMFQKVHDTMACLLAAYRKEVKQLHPFCQHLFCRPNNRVQFIMFIVQKKDKATKYRSPQNILQDVKKHLKPFQFQVRTASLADPSPDGTWRAYG